MEEQTRRSWLITIGQATVGLGVAGWLPCYSADAVDLPPGIYLPSKDHLSHALMNTERYHPIPPGYPTGFAVKVHLGDMPEPEKICAVPMMRQPSTIWLRTLLLVFGDQMS